MEERPFARWEAPARRRPARLRHTVVWTKRISGVTSTMTSLETLALRSVLEQLENAVEVYAHQRASLKPLHFACVARVPWMLRQKMLDQLLASGRIYDTVEMGMLEVLMDKDIRHLSVRHVRKWYRENFLQLLKRRGGGLQTLVLEEVRPSLESHISLDQCFTNTASLISVSLRCVCDDIILAALGRNCPVLQDLDVEGATGVTDLGVRALCFKGTILPTPADKTSQDPPVSEGGCFCRLYARLERWLLFVPPERSDDDGAVVGLSWWRASLMKKARKNSCCKTLRCINLLSTSATRYKSKPLLETCIPQARVCL